ncbi:histidine-type phosphatase [Rhodanobacter sp. BL-MT-08]
MTRHSRSRRLFLGAFALVAAWACASPQAGAAHAAPAERIVQQIVLIRHGIRSPTAAPDALAVYAAEPWPAWPAGPGQLTSHGARLMQSLGRWYRKQLASAGVAADACGTHPTLKLIADSTPRNRDSAAAMLGGLSSSCPRDYFAFAASQADPLFRGNGGGDADPPLIVPLAVPALKDLQQVLLGCHDAACLKKAAANGKKLLLGTAPAKALKSAGTLSENLMLEYAQGMPLAQVGWGRLDAAGVGTIITLHNLQFALAKKTPDAANARGGNMLAHIAATLTAAAGQASKLLPLAPADTQAVILLGHDTDLASQAGLLGLDWRNVEQPDDYPPGGALIYQLIESRGHYAVRLQIALPTLAALRAGDVAPAGAMHIATLRIKGCEKTDACPLATFQAIIAKNVEASAIVAGTGNEPRVR